MCTEAKRTSRPAEGRMQLWRIVAIQFGSVVQIKGMWVLCWLKLVDQLRRKMVSSHLLLLSSQTANA
jgi:hypothetical protein